MLLELVNLTPDISHIGGIYFYGYFKIEANIMNKSDDFTSEHKRIINKINFIKLYK
ncbi:MAG: hypothetical protein ACYCSW_11010 [bacterium]|jgi:hypothetical protein